MDSVLNNKWSECLKYLENAFTSVVFNTWIKTLTPLKVEDGVLYLKTNDFFHKSTIEQRYLVAILNTVNTVFEPDLDVRIVIEEDSNYPNSIKNENSFITNLKSKYVFENFVRGKSNELAYAAAVAVAEAPGVTSYNPLFLYGGVGLGKTHLMHSIGNYVIEQDPEKKVLYVSTETFTNELISSILERKNQEFRNKYREIDVLLIDDIQFLSEKEGTQEEFFHTFNTLYDANKQIVISSDQPPKEIKTLESRLRSRFGCGLIVDISSPDFETRTAILEKKATSEGVDMPPDVTKFIAKNISSNIRELEGAFNKVKALSKLTGTQISLELTEKALIDLISDKEKKQITVEYIIDIVSNYYGITPKDIIEKKRTQSVSYPRQIAMYLSRKLLSLSLPKIGEAFGGRDHSTIIHGCDKIAKDIENDDNLKDVVILLENKIKA